MRSSPTSKVRYRRPAGVGGEVAIMELSGDGTAVFWSQEFGDVRWFQFTPGDEERTAVLCLVGSQNSTDGWARLHLK